MSPRQVLGYEGEGRARRPIYRDETIDTSPLAGLPVGSPEAAAAIDRVAGVKAAETYGRTAYPKESVLNGARRHQEVMAERRAAVTRRPQP